MGQHVLPTGMKETGSGSAMSMAVVSASVLEASVTPGCFVANLLAPCSFHPAIMTGQGRAAVSLISTRSPVGSDALTQARHGQPLSGIHSHQTSSISDFLEMSGR